MTEKMKTIIIERNDLLKILSEDRARQASSAKQMLHDWENEKE